MNFGDPLFPQVYDLLSNRAGVWGGMALFLAVTAAMTLAVTETRAGWALRRRVRDSRLFTCARCLGFWVGAGTAFIVWGPARDVLGPLGAILDGLLSSFTAALLAPAIQRSRSVSDVPEDHERGDVD